MRRWLRHPNNRSGPKDALRPLILEEVTSLLSKELPIFDKRMSKAEPNHETLTSFDVNGELERVKEHVLTLYSLLYGVATTERSRLKNTKKGPE